jgi:hypothetical protein
MDGTIAQADAVCISPSRNQALDRPVVDDKAVEAGTLGFDDAAGSALFWTKRTPTNATATSTQVASAQATILYEVLLSNLAQAVTIKERGRALFEAEEAETLRPEWFAARSLTDRPQPGVGAGLRSRRGRGRTNDPRTERGRCLHSRVPGAGKQIWQP